MVKIIKRIIVGVGIALVLSAFSKYGLIGNVYAYSVYNIQTDQIQYGVQGSSSVYTPSLQSHTITGVPHTTFNGATLNNTTDISWIKYRFASTGLPYQNARFNMSFVLLQTYFQSQHNQPLVVYLVNSKNDHYTCSVNSGSNDRSSSETAVNHTMSYSSTVYCQDIGLATGNFYVIVNGSVTTSNPHKFGISQMSVWNINDSQGTIDAINNNTQATQQINNTISDSATDDPTSDIGNMSNKNASNGSITQLITLPITMYQSILNATSGSCSSFNLGNLLGTNITLPCINLQNVLGSTLFGIIDILISGLFILSFRKKMVDIFNHMTSLNDRGNELE